MEYSFSKKYYQELDPEIALDFVASDEQSVVLRNPITARINLWPHSSVRVCKKYVDENKMRTSLIALRDELAGGSTHNAIAFKINSCLFSTYPERNHK